jgi:transcriptional regulator with XRE-family HTH domain
MNSFTRNHFALICTHVKKREKSKMSQESIIIDSVYLKHLRRKKGESQNQTADAIYISTRQLQNIEQHGRTSTRVASFIAKHFEIGAEALIRQKNQDDSLWYITTPYKKTGIISEGYREAICDIKKTAKRFNDEASVRLIIDAGDTYKKISVLHHNRNLCWTMRPVELDEKIGLIWTQLTQWQEFNWEETLDSLKYGHANNVLVDNKPVVPMGKSVQFIVHFETVNNNEHTRIGHRVFPSNAALRVSLIQWLDAFPTFCSPSLWKGNGSLTFVYDIEKLSSKKITIAKVWVDEEGKPKRAPWPSAEIDAVKDAITITEKGKRKWAIPIGSGEIFEGENPPTMTPEVMTNHIEIIEIPEFKIHSTRSD